MSDHVIVLLGSLFILVGVLLAVLALVLPAMRSGGLRGHGGAVVIVGPFPIVFGSDQQTTKALLVFAIALVIAMAVLFLFERF